MSPAIGHRRWAIAEGYIPPSSTGPEPQMTSHETASMLNASDDDATVEITLYFTDREPAGPYRDETSRPAARCTYALTSLRTRSRSHGTPTTRAS